MKIVFCFFNCFYFCVAENSRMKLLILKLRETAKHSPLNVTTWFIKDWFKAHHKIQDLVSVMWDAKAAIFGHNRGAPDFHKQPEGSQLLLLWVKRFLGLYLLLHYDWHIWKHLYLNIYTEFKNVPRRYLVRYGSILWQKSFLPSVLTEFWTSGAFLWMLTLA